VSFNVPNNPFRGAYLLNYTPQIRTRKPEEDPNTKTPDNANKTGGSGNSDSELQTFMDAQFRKRNALENRKKNSAQSQPKTMQEMLQDLNTQRAEVDRLKHQLDSTNDPALHRLLQEQFGSKSQSFSSLESQVSLLFRGPGGGFVGSEGKIDHIGSFVTTS
jgi:hypothetical protein